MRRASVIGPLILICLGVLFLVNNFWPSISIWELIAQFWPYILIVWGALRLVEIAIWRFQGKPIPMRGMSGGEWVLIVFFSFFAASATEVRKSLARVSVRCPGSGSIRRIVRLSYPGQESRGREILANSGGKHARELSNNRFGHKGRYHYRAQDDSGFQAGRGRSVQPAEPSRGDAGRGSASHPNESRSGDGRSSSQRRPGTHHSEERPRWKRAAATVTSK